MLLNPKLYEINTRVWLNKLQVKLADVPVDYFIDLKDKGIDVIWLMGVWNNSEHLAERYCFTPDLMNSYHKALKDWQKVDVIGSPYAIDSYNVNPRIGTNEDLVLLKEKLNAIGLKLFLDFIPNHLSAASGLVQSKPDLFLKGDEELLQRDPFTFFRDEASGQVFAHGRDPLFPAWQDTIQVNFFNESTREFFTEELLRITDFCDGLRCDMAMLPLNNIFSNTWVGPIKKQGLEKPSGEFWTDAIKKVKKKKKDFIFLAETYWDLEWDLQQLGFDFTYDKRLLDRLQGNDINGVKAHLKADITFQQKSVRFIENHDEQRAALRFGKCRSLAAATVMSTVPGMKLYYHGQFQGNKTKLPVQLLREPEEKNSGTISRYYDKLLRITSCDIFRLGEWKELEPASAGTDNFSYLNFFAWEWKHNDELRIVVINYSEITSQCRLHLDVFTSQDNLILYDLLNDRSFERSKKEILEPGLFIELKAYGAHILALQSA